MFLVGGVLFLVIEFKLCLRLGDGLADYITQLFLELVGKWCIVDSWIITDTECSLSCGWAEWSIWLQKLDSIWSFEQLLSILFLYIWSQDQKILQKWRNEDPWWNYQGYVWRTGARSVLLLNQKSISDLILSLVCNKIFGLVLTAYISGLKTIMGWSHDWAANQDVSLTPKQ